MSTSESAEPAEQPLASEESPAVEPREPIVRETEREVVLQRSVRFGRILLVGAIIGAVLGVAVSFAYPVAEDAEYTINQVVGFMLFIGAAAGFVAAALLSLILSLVARRNRGTGVAIQADVR